MPAGRPTDYSQELADKICSLLAEGKSLRTVCKPNDMPDKASVFRWLRTYPQFCDQYAKSKEESSDAMVEDMLDIADDAAEKEDGKIDAAYVNAQRLRVDTRKWIASKLKPKKYGERMDITTDGKPLNRMSDEELEALIAEEATKISK